MTDSRPLRDDIREQVLDLLLRGKLPPGSRIVESQLCSELGVSRTPLREALFSLEQEGFVQQDKARGFSAVPLTEREMREIYPMLWTLEGLALRMSPRASSKELKALRARNNRTGKSAPKVLRSMKEMEAGWHAELLKRCRSQRLLSLIASLKRMVMRYEYVYVRESGKELISVARPIHSAILEALGKDDVDKAVALLEEDWRTTMAVVLDWFAWREPAD